MLKAKKIVTRVMAVAAVAGFSVGMAMPALAATYEPVEGTTCNFNKYLIVDAGDKIPNATFRFTVEAGAGINAGTDTMQVLPGVGTPTIADVTFGPSDATATEAGTNLDIARTNVQRGGSAGDAVQLDEGEKYATKQATVNFSGIKFDEPGIYRYLIKETAGTQSGIIYDTDTDRVLDVYVTDDGTGTLVVSSYVLHTDVSTIPVGANMGSGSVTANGDALDDKTDGFTNEYTSKDLKVEVEVAGNQASRDKYFAVTVKAAAGTVNSNDSFEVSLTNDSNAGTNDGRAESASGTTAATKATYRSQTNALAVTGQELLDGKTFYLQHGQSVVIRGLAPSVNYTVTEDAEDYKSAVKDGDTNNGVLGEVAGQSKMASAGFTNTKNGIIPTGVLMTVIPGAIVFLGGGFGIAAVKMRKRREEKEED